MVKNFKKKKMIISICIIIAILAFIIFFIKIDYKNLKAGNNMSNKNIEEIEEYILNISSYEATIEVTINSNKNTNKYILLQQYLSPNLSKQIVLEPSNIEGLEIMYDGQSLSINNTKLNLNKVYENYEYVIDNYLNLESFIADYKACKEQNKTKLYEENDEYVLEASIENSEYIYNKKLYISKKTGNPTKLLIEDVNEKTLVYILYNEININGLETIAFKGIEPHVQLY